MRFAQRKRTLSRAAFKNLTRISRFASALTVFFALTIAPAQAQISDPTQITNLRVWYDAADINGNGVQPANGATVSAWQDKSGNGNTLTAPSGREPSFESTGLDGVNPALRFVVGDQMTAPNPFAANYNNDTTIFFVHFNVSQTTNAVVSLNGTKRASSGIDGRFFFHAPWSTTGTIYFDAGGCCGSTRLYGPYGSSGNVTTLVAGQNDVSGSKQLLRVDGATIASDTSAISTSVNSGLNIGTMPGTQNYDGKMAEIVIYDRSLTLSEIQDVECYLMAKWVPWKNAQCVPEVRLSKARTVWSGNQLAFDLPGNDIIYDVTATKDPGNDIAKDSLFLVDTMPADAVFYNGDPDGGGPLADPVSFSDAGSGLSFNYASAVGFASGASAPGSFSSCTYNPAPGYDPNVRYICVRPSGAFSGNNTSFTIHYRAQIK